MLTVREYDCQKRVCFVVELGIYKMIEEYYEIY